MSPDSVVMFQYVTSSLSATHPEMDNLPTLPGGTQLDHLELLGLMISLRYWHVFDRYVRTATRSCTVEGSHYCI